MEPKMENDRRKRRTKQALQKSMVELILEKGYDAVSVSEITDRADLGRATFYLHYKDKDELLIETIDQIVRDFMVQISDYTILPLETGDDTILHRVFLFAQENSDLFRVIMRGHGMYTATLQLHAVIAGFIHKGVELWLASQKREPAVPLDILSNFYSGALLNSVFWWLENDTGYSPEEMAENYKKLVFLNREDILGGK
jgi:AcrR family transcriptional regulator